MQNMTCSSCGAPLQIENQFVRSVTCQFCGAAYVISGDATLDPTGKTTSLANYPSRVSVGTRGTIRGRGFTILGRIRYTYDEGYWDEWQIAWDDDAPPDWLEEDEGYWTVYKKERVRAEVLSYDGIRVGQTVKINNRNVFITEKRQARVLGSEGQFAAVMPLQGDFGYVQGAADEQTVSITYWEDEIEISSGDDLEHHEMKLDR
ncbi:MAG: hypothetical protein OHK0046_02030 [Anaerolineae bacterium]